MRSGPIGLAPLAETRDNGYVVSDTLLKRERERELNMKNQHKSTVTFYVMLYPNNPLRRRLRHPFHDVINWRIELHLNSSLVYLVYSNNKAVQTIGATLRASNLRRLNEMDLDIACLTVFCTG